MCNCQKEDNILRRPLFKVGNNADDGDDDMQEFSTRAKTRALFKPFITPKYIMFVCSRYICFNFNYLYNREAVIFENYQIILNIFDKDVKKLAGIEKTPKFKKSPKQKTKIAKITKKEQNQKKCNQ